MESGGGAATFRDYDSVTVYFSAAALLIGLGLGLWLKSWRLVAALVVAGLAVSTIGWLAGWFADVNSGGDFTAFGGALVFWLLVCLPLAVGAVLGVCVVRSSRRRPPDHASTLPIVPPPNHRRHG